MDKKTIDHIKNVLRQGTITWHIRNECLKRDRKRFTAGLYKNGNAKLIYKYRCNKCENYFKSEEVEVDHIEEVGSFTGSFDSFIEKLYCSLENLQTLCVSCHLKKTKTFNAFNNMKRK